MYDIFFRVSLDILIITFQKVDDVIQDRRGDMGKFRGTSSVNNIDIEVKKKYLTCHGM